MSSQTINLFVAALKGVLRELPDGASGFRVEPGALGYVTVQLMGPHGPLVACTVAQRIAPKSDGKQLTIDDAINRRSPKAVAPAPRVEKRRGPEKTGSRETLDETVDRVLASKPNPYAPDAAGWTLPDGTPITSAEARALIDGPPEPAKASKKLYRDQGHALDAPHAHPNTAHLVIRVAEGASPQTHLRPAGLDDAAWRRVCAGHVGDAVDAYGGIAVARLYSSKGKCLWDSRDGGAP